MENIKSYLDGELDLAQQTEVETHLRNDADLQKMVEEFSAISATLKTVDTGEPFGQDKLEARLAEVQTETKSENKKIWRIAAYWSGSAACIALAAMIFFPVFAQSKVDAKRSMQMKGLSGSSNPFSSGSAPTPASTPSSAADEERSEFSRSEAAAGKAQVSGEERLQNAQVPGSIGGTTTEAPAVELQDGAPQVSKSIQEQDKSASSTQEPGDRVYANKSPDSGNTLNLEEKAKRARTQSKSGGGGRKPAESAAKSSAESPKYANTEPESQFKQDMRTIRDKAEKNPTSLNDTPHGIYLERTGQIQVKVEDLMRSVDETTGMVQSLDGYVVNHELQNEADGGIATMSVKVPTKNYNTAMNKLQAMGEVINVNSTSQDITTETVDNSTRMISWADEEKRLMDELAKAKTSEEKYRLRRLLNEARANLSSYRETVKSLKERAEYSTINISFVRGDKADKAGGTSNWSGNAFRDAKSGLGSIGQVLGVICIYTLVFCPLWLPFAIAALVIRNKNKS